MASRIYEFFNRSLKVFIIFQYYLISVKNLITKNLCIERILKKEIDLEKTLVKSEMIIIEKCG